MRPLLIILALLIFVFCNQGAFAQGQTDTTGDVASKVVESIKEVQPEWSFSVGKLVWSIIVLIGVYVIVRYVTRLLEVIAERWAKARLTIKGIIPVFRILGWTFAMYLIIVEVLAPPMATVLAVSASAGIAVGFAFQDILKNIFGGIAILFDRPFQVGDKIEVGTHYGEVVSIGLRTVRVVTPDDSLVSIPNSEVVSQSVSNANSGESNCQVVAEFFLPPEIDLIKAKKIAYEAAVVSRYVYLNKPVSIIVKNEIHQGRSLLKIRLKAYVLDIRYEFPFASEMTETVISELMSQSLVTADQLSLVQKGI